MGPTKSQAAADVLIFIVTALVFYGIEEFLRSVNLFPFPAALDGALSLIASFLVVIILMKWRDQGWRDFGLRKPNRWWTIPGWAAAILIVNIIAQNTLVPAMALWLQLTPPDFSRYDIVYQNLPMLLLVMSGAMITGGFMEEYIYRGFMIDRLSRLFGGGRRGLVLAAILNGLPFGIIHFEWGIGGILLTTVMGSVLGLMYLAAKRNLWPLIVAHASLDALLMIMLYYGVTP
ncbi:MAG: CPBP family intramembrane metalloprotease [Gammaproteobacteria bacterium]|nr:CPBP family intramembrane metalloprotease [Gammaproteobacteria bacterium]